MTRSVQDILASVKRWRAGPVDLLLVHVDSFYVIARCNLGLLCLATFLEERGFRVRVLTPMDFFCQSLADIENLLRESRPTLLGFYTNSDNIHQVAYLAKRARGWLPQVRVVIGGPQASAVGESLLESPWFDMAVQGEGELPLLALLEYFVNGKGELSDIPSLIFKDGGRIIENERCKPIEDLDSLPIPDQRFLGAAPATVGISSGRGCPHRCAFCFQAVHGRGYRFRSPKLVFEEIVRNLERFNAKTFSIFDDTFVANPRRVEEICSLLEGYRKTSGRDFGFYCEGRADILARYPELLERLKRAGLIRLQIGIESGSQEILDLYCKGITPEQVREVVARCRDLGGISVVGHFILGGARETEETFERSLSFATELLEMAPGVFETLGGIFAPYPGTDIFRDPEKYGLRVIDGDFKSSLSILEAFCETESLSRERIRVMRTTFEREINKKMKELIPLIPFHVMAEHFRWAKDFGMTSFWHGILNGFEALRNYFFFIGSPRFCRLKDVENRDPGEWFPMRSIGLLQYDRSGKTFDLRGSFRRFRINNQMQRSIYSLSAGKMTAREVAAEVKINLSLSEDEDTILREAMFPFYKRLQDVYQIIFYQ